MSDQEGPAHLSQLRFAALVSFAAAALVIGLGGLISGQPVSLLATLLQSAAISGCVAGYVAILRRRGDAADWHDTATVSNPATRPDFEPTTRTLNEQGVTIKLLELMALGDRYGNKFSIAVVGVDHFESVRRHYGQSIANAALRAIAAALTETLRMPDRLGRHGEERFLVLLPETDIHGARQIGERLRAAVSRADVDTGGATRLGFTVSIGVTSHRRGDDLYNLLSRATRAMEQARDLGCNRVLIDLAA